MPNQVVHPRLAGALALLTAAAGMAAAPAESAAGRAAPDLPSLGGPAARPTRLYRRYNACAQVTIFGIPVFSRCGVGGGFAEESWPQGEKAISLQFVSGSSPERAHGLNRMGLIQEMVREDGARPATYAYFGFITASKEETVSQAKRALEESGGKERVPFSVAEGQTAGSSMRYSVYHIELPASYRWPDAAQMLADVGAQLKELPADPQTLDASAAAGGQVQLQTFLYAVRRTLVSPGGKGEEYVVHNSQAYRLTWSKTRDTKAGVEFERAGLAGAEARATRVSAVIRNLRSGDETPFTVWYDAHSPNELPLRFEFRPRPFLKLVFQADPAGAAPPALKMRASLR